MTNRVRDVCTVLVWFIVLIGLQLTESNYLRVVLIAIACIAAVITWYLNRRE
jgi:hypothetical protein